MEEHIHTHAVGSRGGNGGGAAAAAREDEELRAAQSADAFNNNAAARVMMGLGMINYNPDMEYWADQTTEVQRDIIEISALRDQICQNRKQICQKLERNGWLRPKDEPY